MGDRGNIVTGNQDGGPKIYMYSHWGGSGLKKDLQKALKRGKGRWNDEEYLNRIIFSEIIQDEVLSTTGYGLHTRQGDGDIRATVHLDTQQVETSKGAYSFEEYINLPEEAL